jgi:hypothetical protein
MWNENEHEKIKRERTIWSPIPSRPIGDSEATMVKRKQM